MTVTHKKAARILQNWNLSNETVAEIFETNKRMTAWLMDNLDELSNI